MDGIRETSGQVNPPAPRKYAAKLMISVAIGAVFVWLLRKGALPVMPAGAAAFRGVDTGAVAAGSLCWLVGFLCRSGRWYWLLAPLRKTSLSAVLRLSFAGIAAVVALPLRAGEIVRLLMIQRTTKISVWEATGTVGAERVVDGLVLSAMLFLGLVFAHPIEPLPDHIGKLAIPTRLVAGAAYAALAVFVSAFVVMIVFYFRREWARRTTERIVGVVSPRFARVVADKLALVADGLSFLASPAVAVPFVAATITHWVCLAGSLLLLGRATGFPDLGFSEACVVIGTISLGILVPSAPGYFGAFQLAVYAALALYFPTDRVIGSGPLFVFFLYVLQVGAALAIGSAALLFSPTRPTEAAEATGSSS